MEKNENKVRDFFIGLLCAIVGIAIIVGIIAVLVLFVYPWGKLLEVVPVFCVAIVLLIAFIGWNIYNKIKKSKEKKLEQ